MDAFKAQLERLKQQFSALNASQRMLVGTLVAVMALTLLYWSHYAGSPEMVPVLDGTLTTEQIGSIDNALESHNIEHQVVGGKVMVAAERKSEALASLMSDDALPDNKESIFEEMNKQLNPFNSPDDHQETHVIALDKTLEEVIRHMQGVRGVDVIINDKSERRIEDSVLPSASVFVTSRGGIEKPKAFARLIAKGVAGTVSGLRQENVTIAIDGITYSTAADGADGIASSDDLQDAKQRSESAVTDKIRHGLFPFIAGLQVVVTCDVENSTRTEHKVSFDKATSLSLPQQEHEHNEETSGGGSSASAEPGMGANTSASIPTPANIGAATGNTSSTNDTTNTNQNAFGTTEESVATPAGKSNVMSATVLVPRSYLVTAYKLANGNKEANSPAFQAFADSQLADMKTKVKTSIAIKSDSDLSIGMYFDLLPTEPATASIAPPSASLAVITGHSKEIALGVLAVVSLFMMSSMVRKSTPAPSVVLPGGPMGAGALAGMSPFAAGASSLGGETLMEAGMSTATLDGVEMDDESARTQQMLEQVSTMVKENPDNAAALVKRWMSRV